MMGLSLSISTDNAAFADGNQLRECTRILRDAAKELTLIDPGQPATITLRDINGNAVGQLGYRPTWHAGGDDQ